MAKSYWQQVSVDSPRCKASVKALFAPLCDGMTPYKAEILCDAETDREKKYRAFMTDDDGQRFRFERTRVRADGTFSLSISPIGRVAEGSAAGA
jgi:hypothetical protein